jgi:hypothetical protein
MVVELGVALDLPVVLMIIGESPEMRSARMVGLSHRDIRLHVLGGADHALGARAAVQVGRSWLLGQVVSHEPDGHLVIRRDGARVADHRSAPRVRAPVRARWCPLGPRPVEEPGHSTWEGYTEISVSGMVLPSCALPSGARVSIELQIGEKGPIGMVAIVRRPTPTGAAVEFADVRDDDAEALSDFVLDHL